MMHSADLRNLLQEALGCQVPDRLWGYLDEMRFVAEVLDDAADVNYLADQARKVLSVSGNRPPGRESPRMLSLRKENAPTNEIPESVSLRTRAISILFAQEAEERVEVQSFRREFLGEKLLAHEEVSDWIKTQAKADGPETLRLTVQVEYGEDGSIRTEPLSNREWVLRPPPGQTDVIVGDSQVTGGKPRVLEIEYLEYSFPGKPWLQLQPIASGGVLESLQKLGFYLAARYSWTTAQATMFILTGLNPEVAGIETNVRRGQANARITLVIDPIVPPSEVTNEYQRLRREIMPRRHRSLSDKHLRLAAFVAERPESESWEDRMKGWNATYPEPEFDGYSYSHRSNFIRDAIQARQHLLYPEYDFRKVSLEPDRSGLLLRE